MYAGIFDKIFIKNFPSRCPVLARWWHAPRR